MERPLVSVIIPTYNRSAYLSSAIKSVVDQTYKNIEIIVVDDGSEINYAEEICLGHRGCSYYYKTNGGISSARNYGVSISRGSLIAFLDDDDLFLPRKIEIQVDLILKKKDVDCVHSSALVIDKLGNLTGKIIGASESKAHLRSGNVFWNALGVWLVKSPTPLFRRKVFDYFLFDESIEVGEDVDFYQRVFFKHKIFYVKEPLALYRDDYDPDRLSKRIVDYNGLESKIYLNFRRMGIKNPITLYRIALRLAQTGIKRLNFNSTKKAINVSKLRLFLNPFFYVKNLNKLN